MIVQAIRNELEMLSDPEEKRKRITWEKGAQKSPRLYGVPAPAVRKLSSIYFQQVKKKPKQEILQLCNNLLESNFSEERTIAFDWVFRLRKQYERSDFQLLETWLTEHVHGWGLLTDQDIMVRKGYGWMLKEASNHYPKNVFNYVMKNRREMPRTALRYAIEKLHPELKKEAMKRE